MKCYNDFNATMIMTEKNDTKEMTARQIVIAFGLLFLSLGVMSHAKDIWMYLLSVLILLIDVIWIINGAKKGG